jgi:cytochrome c2
MMLLRVYVGTQEQFDAWIRNQQQPAHQGPAVEAGRKIFERQACMNCHTVSGTAATGRFGPDLTHLMSQATLASGATDNTPANLRQWIKSPDTFKHGALMPAMQLNDEQLDQITAYLETLKLRQDSDMSDYPLPISQGIDPGASALERDTFIEKFHEWVVTVDHKRLGILYILYSTFFLLVAGAEALLIRIQLAYPHNHVLSAQVYSGLWYFSFQPST